MKFSLPVASAFIAISLACVAQQQRQALTNESIVKMVRAGLDQSVILSMIRSQPGDYTVTPDAVIALKKAGVSEEEMAAMAVKGTTVASPSASSVTRAYSEMDIGVYTKIKGQWTMLQTERVTWRTGGFLKSLATDGIVKGDINGRLRGSTSPNKVFTPLKFLIRTADGSQATDYELVHTHQKKSAREFRTVTGGVFHSSGGSTKDAVSFEQQRIARDTYEVTLPDSLPPGEYAFLAPGFTGSSASGSSGKAYSFHHVE